MRDDGGDYVSMHHRIRRDLRRRLKHLSAESEKPVTDLVNQAIESALERVEGEGAVSPKIGNLQTSEILRRLKEAHREERYFAEAMSFEKRDLVQVAQFLGVQVDVRASGDRIISIINNMIR